MNPEKAEKLFSLMKKYGVEYLKNEKIEIKMIGGPATSEVIVPSSNKETTPRKEPRKNTKLVPPQAIPPVEVNIPHHVNEVSNLLKLDDYALVDKLFPDYTQEDQVNANA